jgi:CRP-like cAMP-binding protein
MARRSALTAEEDERLYARFSANAALSRSTWRGLVARGKREQVARGGFFTQPGEPATRFAFVLRGLLRHYYVDSKAREWVKDFSVEGDLAAPYAEILSRRRSRTFIEAMIPSELWVLEMSDFEAAARDSLELQRAARMISEHYFVAKEQREYEFLQLSAERRYRQFCERNPALVRHVPQYQVASYIGVTAVALSRIRARLRRRQVAVRPRH